MHKVALLVVAVTSVLVGCTAPPERDPEPLEAPEVVVERTSDLTAMDCLDIDGTVMAVEYTFSQGESTPGEVMLILDYTATELTDIASGYAGSERDWLLKMAELSQGLSDFVDTGAGDGELLFDQLSNNFGLVEQFCG